jgi:uncharacterized membrane protein YphA (DoxX/SURF4 family)
MRPNQSIDPKKLNVALWTVQVLLALLFLFAGGTKLVMPIAEMTKQMPMPGWFLRFLGVAEIAGALGLVLPGLFHRRPELTPLAARCLVIIMSGAVALTLQGSVAAAAIPAVVGILAGLVAHGRSQLLPHREGRQAARPRTRQVAITPLVNQPATSR